MALVCTLKPAPEASSSELMARRILDALGAHGAEQELVRVADLDVAPSVEQGHGRRRPVAAGPERILAADVLLLTTPTWVGHMSSVAQRVLERLDAELSETDDPGRPGRFGKVGVVGVVGNEDGAHKVIADTFQALNDTGLTLPAQAATYWNAEAMNPRDYKDLDETQRPSPRPRRRSRATRRIWPGS